jgi:hypothetical protein
LPQLSECPFVELVSTCDIIPERAANQAKGFNVPNHYPHIDRMLDGAEFDLMVNLRDHSSWLGFLDTVRTERYTQILALKPLIAAIRVAA